MSWRLKLSNWLSKGSLFRYQRQAELAKAAVTQHELTIEKLNAQLKQKQTEIKQLDAQLKIGQGFQIELGETQIKLRKAIAESEDCRKKLPEVQKQLVQLKGQLQQTQQDLSQSQDWLQQLNNTIQVVDIQKRLPKQEFDKLWGFGVTSPNLNDLAVAGSVLIKGWILGRRSTITHIRVSYQQQTIIETPVNLARPEITNKYPEIPQAYRSGFETAISVVGIPSTAELLLEAILQDEPALPICAISLVRRKKNQTESN